MDNRKRLIREVLDQDMNINRRVADITRQKVFGIPEEVSPYIQINQEEINKMSAAAGALRQLLEKKTYVSEQILKNEEDAPPNDLVVDVAHVEEVVAAYNVVVGVYLNPQNTQETRSYILRMLVAFEPIVNRLSDNMRSIIGLMNTGGWPHRNLMIYAYAFYDILLQQLRSGNFHIVHMADIKYACSQRSRDTGPAPRATAPFLPGRPPPGDPPGPPGGGTPDEPPDEAPGDPRPGPRTEPPPPRPTPRLPFPQPGAGPRRRGRSRSLRPSAEMDDSWDMGPASSTWPRGREPDDDVPGATPGSFGSTHGVPRTPYPQHGPQFFDISDETPPTHPAASASTDHRFEYKLPAWRRGPKAWLKESVLAKVIKAYNDQDPPPIHPLTVTPEEMRRPKALRRKLQTRIRFLDTRGHELPMEGAGLGDSSESDEDDPPPPDPVIPYNDIRNDPYFVVR